MTKSNNKTSTRMERKKLSFTRKMKIDGIDVTLINNGTNIKEELFFISFLPTFYFFHTNPT
jgi:hypothetical protein